MNFISVCDPVMGDNGKMVCMSVLKLEALNLDARYVVSSSARQALGFYWHNQYVNVTAVVCIGCLASTEPLSFDRAKFYFLADH